MKVLNAEIRVDYRTIIELDKLRDELEQPRAVVVKAEPTVELP
jgi:NAD/NADP transhydrogenase beta subunit